MERTLVFTDLGGTLLDNHSYSWAAAGEALAALEYRRMPLVLVSSRTLPEVRRLRAQLNNHHPCIVENGGACMVPGGYFAGEPPGQDEHIELHGPSREHIRSVLEALRAQDSAFDFCSCADLGARGLAERLGLSPEAARMADQRLCSEPLFWEGDQAAMARFESVLEARGLRLLRGQRLLHVLGSGDRGTCAEALKSRYRAAWPGDNWFTVGLGDSNADEALLRRVDLAVIIPPREGAALRLDNHPAVLRARHSGPWGWQEAMERVLERLPS